MSQTQSLAAMSSVSQEEMQSVQGGFVLIVAGALAASVAVAAVGTAIAAGIAYGVDTATSE